MKKILKLLPFLMVVGFAGCASHEKVGDVNVPGVEGGVEREVSQRALLRWKYLIAGDLESAYGLLSPGSRARTSFESYKARLRPGMWKEAQVSSARCEGQKCLVAMEIVYEKRDRDADWNEKGTGLIRVKTSLMEDWIEEGGTWWYVPRR